jgi:four helix bundle protein
LNNRFLTERASPESGEPRTMPASNNPLHEFGAYQKALELFDHVVRDLSPLSSMPTLHRLIAQQYASADSVPSNIEEGFGRGGQREYAQYLLIARGSAQETCGRYGRLKHWLPEEVIKARVDLCEEIIRMLTRSVQTLRRRL